jgi:hypothetical protein
MPLYLPGGHESEVGCGVGLKVGDGVGNIVGAAVGAFVVATQAEKPTWPSVHCP